MKKIFTLCLIAISYILDWSAGAQGSVHQLNNGFPIGATAASQRHIYNELVKNPKYAPYKKQIGFGYLRVEQALSNTSGIYSFNIKRVGGEIATERKLDQNDVFYCTHIGVYLANMLAASPSKAVLQSYPNDTAMVATQAPDLEAVYNGTLSVKVGTNTNPEAVPMNIFRIVPALLQSASTNRTEFNVPSTTAFLGHHLIFAGNQSIDITLNVPMYAGIAWAHISTPTSDNKVIFHPYGFLIKGAAAAMIAADANASQSA